MKQDKEIEILKEKINFLSSELKERLSFEKVMSKHFIKNKYMTVEEFSNYFIVGMGKESLLRFIKVLSKEVNKDEN